MLPQSLETQEVGKHSYQINPNLWANPLERMNNLQHLNK
jgi:hypothetical protein